MKLFQAHTLVERERAGSELSAPYIHSDAEIDQLIRAAGL